MSTQTYIAHIHPRMPLTYDSVYTLTMKADHNKFKRKLVQGPYAVTKKLRGPKLNSILSYMKELNNLALNEYDESWSQKDNDLECDECFSISPARFVQFWVPTGKTDWSVARELRNDPLSLS